MRSVDLCLASALSSSVLLSCYTPPDVTDDGGSSAGTETSGASNTSPTGMSMSSPTTTSADTTGGMTMGQTDDTTAGAGPDTADGSAGSTDVDPGSFVPDDPDPSLYTRVDRVGMPAVSTVLITMDNRDAYNDADPSDDSALEFQADITASIISLLDALTDDIMGLSLSPCPDPNQSVNTQTRPAIIPDTLKLDLGQAGGFPNGRVLSDQVVDMTLALILLDLVPPPNTQSLTSLADLPLNPPQNDVPFLATFPFLAPAH